VAPSPGKKRPRREANHSAPSAEVQNVWSYNSAPLCLRGVGRYKKVRVKVKVKFTLEQATMAQRGSRDIAIRFL
jgi:hypothetical protein